MTSIQHLYWRAGFGLSPAEWLMRKDWSIDQAIDQLFAEATNLSPVPLPGRLVRGRLNQLSCEEREALRDQQRQQLIQVNADWVRRMANPQPSALLERMTLFWHGHFACRSRGGHLAAQQINTIQQHALGNFRDLLLGIARDPAMIRYLNKQQNRKEQPNENFARELMELFTLGRGQYTEADIKAAARAFTGWSSNLQGGFVFRRVWHDYGQKTFFVKTGNWDGEDIIDMILEKPAAAEFITRKIYRYFVHPKVDEPRVQLLAKAFYQSNYDIAFLMRTIFSGDWFYSPENQGRKIKALVELAVGMIKQLGLEFEQDIALLFLQRALGQQLFNPPNVAGWPDGKNWIDNASLMLRLNLAQSILAATQFDFRTKADLEDRQNNGQGRRLSAKANITALHQWLSSMPIQQQWTSLATYLLPTAPSVSTQLMDKYTSAKNPEERIVQMAIRLMSLPEYQLC